MTTLTEFKIERRMDGAQFLYAQVGGNDPDPLEIEVPAFLTDELWKLQDLGENVDEVLLETTVRMSAQVSLENEERFWTVANFILEEGRQKGLRHGK